MPVVFENSNLLLKIWDDFHLRQRADPATGVTDNCRRQIRVLAASLPFGSYTFEWDASQHASGVYLYRLQAGEFVETRKMVLMK